MSRTTLIAMAGICLAWPVAHAQPVSGPYVSLGGGGTILQDEKLQGAASTLGSKLNFDDGPAASGAIGYGFGNGFRVQIDGDWRRNRLHGVSNFGPGASAGGYQDAYAAMADVIFDVDIRQDWIFPYFGAGLGYSWTRWDRIHATGNATNIGYDAVAADGTDGHFAYQGLFGVSVPIPYVAGLSFTAEYRFTGVPSKTSYSGVTHLGLVNVVGHAGGSSAYNHTGLLGIRYALFQPAPPPPAAAALSQQAAPAVEPSRTYLVFFDWDRADLTARARQIVAEAAQASTHVQTTRIEVNGYTDLSGTAAYNQRLSVRRARSVQAELVRDGVAGNEISIHGYGEANPLVQTTQGVREPQNRRVEIVLR